MNTIVAVSPLSIGHLRVDNESLKRQVAAHAECSVIVDLLQNTFFEKVVGKFTVMRIIKLNLFPVLVWLHSGSGLNFVLINVHHVLRYLRTLYIV